MKIAQRILVGIAIIVGISLLIAAPTSDVFGEVEQPTKGEESQVLVSEPSTPAVSTNIDGSITGEASQKAITADSGTPMVSSAAISGMTPQEQKGESPPARAASRSIKCGEPVKARAMMLSAPEAPA